MEALLYLLYFDETQNVNVKVQGGYQNPAGFAGKTAVS